jgi:hypothetical protein
MTRSDRILSLLLLLGAAVTIAYWVNYFVAGDVRVVPDLWYSAFEDAFPVADGWMSICMIAGGVGFWRGRRSAPPSCPPWRQPTNRRARSPRWRPCRRSSPRAPQSNRPRPARRRIDRA